MRKRLLPTLSAVVVAALAVATSLAAPAAPSPAVAPPAKAPLPGLLPRSGEIDWRKNPFNFIAHAGGSIDGLRYVNSVESVTRSVANGYRLIELDLLETSDGRFVAGHSWKEIRRMCGLKERERALSLEQVQECRLLGKYTPLTEKKIVEIFAGNPSLYLVTDKTADYARLKSAFGGFLDRLLVEVKGIENYREAVQSGIRHPMLAVNLDKVPYTSILENGIRFIVIHKKTLVRHEEELAALRERGVEIFVATTDDAEFIGRYIGRSATAFYADGWDLLKGGCSEVCAE
ncbi:MAG TPA: glycerophosphodiester phosphodiesterase family protein [Verrucomicrobiae bacterium]|nr:glycerophosphodiester phosphodiesterase family protein [Verrucomicrobiae bacterium]